jgi:putative transposase
MPRANRYALPGVAYHVTHRCHNRSFLLRFAIDRAKYRKMLRERLKEFPVSLLGYSITSNHTHMLLVNQGGRSALWGFMQSLAGDFAQAYNLRKNRTGAYWGDRYHAVMVDSGVYLWRCLQYIDLNMVRCGVVEHPSDWDFCGYNELVGTKRRNRLIDIRTLVGLLGAGYDQAQVCSAYAAAIEAKLELRDFQREAMWTEALAVGNEDFATRIGSRIPNRMQVNVEPVSQLDDQWVVREQQASYGSENTT